MCVRSAPVTTVSTTSLTVPPSASLIALNWARSPSAHAKRRCGPIVDVVRARRRALQARAQHRAEAVGGLAELPGASSRGARARRPRPARVERRARPLGQRVGDQRRRRSARAAGTTAGGGSGGGSGSASSVEQHGRDVDARDAVDQAVVRLRDHREAPALDAVDEPDLPQRLAAVQPLGEHAPGQVAQLLEAGGLGQRGVAHVVAGVEVRVVDPHRPRLGERRERELLPVARHEVHARVELLDELVVAGRLALEQQARADVHVGAGVLEREEGGVEAGEAIGVRHRPIVAYPTLQQRRTKPSTACV